jgi:outer membrane protein assembly factor BamB
MSRVFLSSFALLAALLGGRPAAADHCLGPTPVEGRVLALNPKTGQATEVYKAKGRLLSAPAVAPGVLYVGSGYDVLAVPLPGSKAKPWSFTANYTVYAIRPTPQAVLCGAGSTLYSLQFASGQENWHYASNGAISEIILTDGLAIFGSHGGIRAVDEQTGKEAWLLPAPWHELSLGGKGTVVGWGLEKTFVGDIKKGVWLWKDDTPGKPVALDRSAVNGVGGGGRLYYLAGVDKAKGQITLAAEDVVTRQPAWQTVLDAELGKLSFLYFVGGLLVLTSEGDTAGASGVYALDAATGKELWHFSAGEPVWRFNRPVADMASVYLSDGIGKLWAVDRGTGQLRWKHVLPQPAAKHTFNIQTPLAGPSAVYVTVNEVTSEPILTPAAKPAGGK